MNGSVTRSIHLDQIFKRWPQITDRQKEFIEITASLEEMAWWAMQNSWMRLQEWIACEGENLDGMIF